MGNPFVVRSQRAAAFNGVRRDVSFFRQTDGNASIASALRKPWDKRSLFTPEQDDPRNRAASACTRSTRRRQVRFSICGMVDLSRHLCLEPARRINVAP